MVGDDIRRQSDESGEYVGRKGDVSCLNDRGREDKSLGAVDTDVCLQQKFHQGLLA